MTREEQIVDAGKLHASDNKFSDLAMSQHRVMSAYEMGFIDGAVWADSHPQWISTGQISDNLSVAEGTAMPIIDWRQVRIQAAIAAMQGMLANPAHHKVQVESGEPFGYFYAMNAIMCADILIAELKKEGGQS